LGREGVDGDASPLYRGRGNELGRDFVLLLGVNGPNIGYLDKKKTKYEGILG
jgi:hypothetical protein